jgi:hypothetical protein
LLPANLSAFTATATSIGIPFQWVMSTPTVKLPAPIPEAIRLTM